MELDRSLDSPGRLLVAFWENRAGDIAWQLEVEVEKEAAMNVQNVNGVKSKVTTVAVHADGDIKMEGP